MYIVIAKHKNLSRSLKDQMSGSSEAGPKLPTYQSLIPPQHHPEEIVKAIRIGLTLMNEFAIVSVPEHMHVVPLGCSVYDVIEHRFRQRGDPMGPQPSTAIFIVVKTLLHEAEPSVVMRQAVHLNTGMKYGVYFITRLTVEEDISCCLLL